MKKGIFLAALFFVTSAYAWTTLKAGTYQLSGGNSSWVTPSYQGEVDIFPQGENYRVVWRIGGRQSQVGIGILQNDIFSVAFVDQSNPSFWGIASYRVINGWNYDELEGKWASHDGQIQKPEYLIQMKY